jgi:hypothetical protein
MTNGDGQLYIAHKWRFLDPQVREAIVIMKADPVRYAEKWNPFFPGEPRRVGPLSEYECKMLSSWIDWAMSEHEPIGGMIALTEGIGRGSKS